MIVGGYIAYKHYHRGYMIVGGYIAYSIIDCRGVRSL